MDGKNFIFSSHNVIYLSKFSETNFSQDKVELKILSIVKSHFIFCENEKGP